MAKSLSIALGTLIGTVLDNFGINPSFSFWLKEAYEPTPYAKIYTKVSNSRPYGITFKIKYNWFYDANFEHKTTTYRTESENYGNYNYYCRKN